MAWTLTHDLDAYQSAAGGLLTSQPVRNTVLLSVLASLTRLGPAAYGDEPPLFGWWSEGGVLSAAVLQTPPHPMLLTDLPGESAAELAAALTSRGLHLPGFNGTERDVVALGRAWQQRTGEIGHPHLRQRLYRLGGLVPPDPAPDGAARMGAAADETLVTSWFSAFAAEAGVRDSPGQVVRSRLASGELMMWDVAGEPRSLAGVTDVIAGVARIGPVYTPPQRRCRGYGGAVTTAISQLALDRGARSVILFTDLANPASNSLYIKLGYEAVEDRVLLIFGPEPGAAPGPGNLPPDHR
jgi:predicted GNAT family acetyltransferase